MIINLTHGTHFSSTNLSLVSVLLQTDLRGALVPKLFFDKQTFSNEARLLDLTWLRVHEPRFVTLPAECKPTYPGEEREVVPMFFRERRAKKAVRRQEKEVRRQAIAKEEKQAQKVKELEGLLGRAEQGDIKAQDELVDRKWYSTNPIRKKRIAANARIVRVRREYSRYGQSTLGAHARWQNAVGTDQEIGALSSFLSYYQAIETEENLSRLRLQLGIKRRDVSRRLQALVKARYEELLSQSEDVGKFEELWDFIRLTRGRSFHDSRGKYWHNHDLIWAAKPLPYPDNWNDLVARHYDTPAVEAFRGLPDRGPGDVRLLADQAVETDSLTDAQIALAYCNSDSKYRAAVGDVLTAKLARVVNRHRVGIAQELDSNNA